LRAAPRHPTATAATDRGCVLHGSARTRTRRLGSSDEAAVETSVVAEHRHRRWRSPPQGHPRGGAAGSSRSPWGLRCGRWPAPRLRSDRAGRRRSRTGASGAAPSPSPMPGMIPYSSRIAPDHPAAVRSARGQRTRGLTERGGIWHVATQFKRHTPLRSVIDGQRGVRPVDVFVRQRGPESPQRRLNRTNNSAWKVAGERAADDWQERHRVSAAAGFRPVRVQDLLTRSANVSGQPAYASRTVRMIG
jgi:hypothetical protein